METTKYKSAYLKENGIVLTINEASKYQSATGSSRYMVDNEFVVTDKRDIKKQPSYNIAHPAIAGFNECNLLGAVQLPPATAGMQLRCVQLQKQKSAINV